MESFEDIKVLMDNFDPAVLLPDLTTLVGQVAFLARIAVLAGPVVLLVMGLLYLFLSPKEANYSFGYRCYYGMGSVEAWRFTQRLAGLVWGGLGLILGIVMFFLTSGFGSGEIMDTIGTGFACMLWEVGLTVLSCLGINTAAMFCFDSKGKPRRRSA